MTWRERSEMALYGVALAAGALLLDLLDDRRLPHGHAAAAVVLVAAAFLLLGLFAGWRLFAPAPATPPGNPAALAALGISAREVEVLHALAAGQSNKEIARTLGISPNTVKTHLARLHDKLGARRRTEALARARVYGLLP